MPEGDSEKNQNGNEIRNLDALKNVNLDAISSSLNEASAELNEKQKQLDGLEEQKKKIVEKLNQKISLIKKQTDEAFQKMKSSSWDDALLNWNKVLEIDPENEAAKQGIAECNAEKSSISEPSSNEALSQEELDKMLLGGAMPPSGASEAMNQDDLDKLLASGGLTPSSEAQNEAAGSPKSVENSNETLSQEELDKLLFGGAVPSKPDEGEQAKESKKEDFSSLNLDSNTDKPMSQDELDAMLNNFSKEGIPDIYSKLGQEGEKESGKKAPEEPEMLSQNQIDALLGITVSQNESSSDLSTEMMTQEELDKLLNPTPASEPQKQTVASPQKVSPPEPPEAELTAQTAPFQLKTTDEDLFQLGSVLNSLAYTAPIKNIVDDPLSELHHKTPENIHYAEIMDDSKNIDEVFKEMATSTGIDLTEVSKMGDTISANVSQEMELVHSEKSTEGAESPVSESISLAARKIKYGTTQMLSELQMVTDPSTPPKYLYALKWLAGILSIGFICTFTSTIILYSELTQEKKEKQLIKAELTSDAKIETIIMEGRMYLDEEQYQKAWDVLFSISDQYPSTSIMITNLYKAADLFNDKCKIREDLIQEDYLNISRLYEQIVDQFQGSYKTERASYLAAENYYMAGIYHKSYELYYKIVSKNPESDYYQSSLLQCAKILLIQNKYKEAREAYLKVVQEFPDTAAAKMSQLDIAKTYQLEALNIRNQFHFTKKN